MYQEIVIRYILLVQIFECQITQSFPSSLLPLFFFPFSSSSPSPTHVSSLFFFLLLFILTFSLPSSFPHNQPQYIFLHDAVLEGIMSGVTEVAVDHLSSRMEELQQADQDGETGYQKEFSVSITVLIAKA